MTEGELGEEAERARAAAVRFIAWCERTGELMPAGAVVAGVYIVALAFANKVHGPEHDEALAATVKLLTETVAEIAAARERTVQ